jgi:hypothetical protein
MRSKNARFRRAFYINEKESDEMSREITDLILEYVYHRVNFKSINEENIDKVAGRISIEFCKMYSPRKNWDVSRAEIKALMIDLFRAVMDGKVKLVCDEGDADE